MFNIRLAERKGIPDSMGKQAMRVLVIGNLAIDSIHRITQPPRIDSSVLVQDTKTYFGGRGANVTVLLQSLGCQTTLRCAAGGDFTNSGYRQYLLNLGVDISDVIVYPQEPCAHAAMYIGPDCHTYTFFFPNAARHFSEVLTVVEPDQFYQLIHLAKLADPDRTMDYLECLARLPIRLMSAGVGQDILDCSREVLRRLLTTVNFMFLNEDELETLLVKLVVDEPAQVLVTVGDELQALVITRGPRGSTIFSHEGTVEVPAVLPGVTGSAIGAGDAYAGGFMYGVCQRWPLAKCARVASTIASFVLEVEGAQRSDLDLTEVERRYALNFAESVHLPRPKAN